MVATPQRATLADLDNTPDDGRQYELIDGEIVVAAAPSGQHQFVVRTVFRLLDTWVEDHQLGDVLFAPFDVVLDKSTVVEPDIAYFATANPAELRDGRFYGIPDLVVEVVSPTNRDRDEVTKLFRYARAGIPEYWLIDPIAHTFSILSLTDDGIYEPIAPNDHGHLPSVVLPDLTIDPTRTFAAATRRGRKS